MNRLFVYGTLRTDCRPSAAQLLGAQARVLGRARTRGALVDLGGYPGLVPAAGEASWVHGQLVELGNAPGDPFHRLDEYEGCAPGSPAPPEFERVVVAVVEATGESGSAWAYVYRGPVEGRPRIAGGEWLGAGS